MNHSPTVRAIDIGYGNTKFTASSSRPELQCALFPSSAPPEQPSAMGGTSGLVGRANDVVEVDGQRYEVGPDTRLFDDPRILHDDYTATPEYLALYRAALGRMQASEIDVLVTGLPVAHLAARKVEVKGRLAGTHPTVNGRSVDVHAVQVIAQPLGGLLDSCVSPDGHWRVDRNTRHLLVDPGYYTLDWVVAEGLKELPRRSGSHPIGVATVLEAVAKALSEDTGARFNDLPRLDDALRSGVLKVRGAPVSLYRYDEAIARVFQPGLNALKNSVGDGQGFDAIFIVGGGSHLLKPALAALYPDHPVETSSEPVFANVRGYQALGESWMREQATGS